MVLLLNFDDAVDVDADDDDDDDGGDDDDDDDDAEEAALQRLLRLLVLLPMIEMKKVSASPINQGGAAVRYRMVQQCKHCTASNIMLYIVKYYIVYCCIIFNCWESRIPALCSNRIF